VGLVTKKIGNNRYVYLIYREGDSVVHRYIGPERGTDANTLFTLQKFTAQVPEKFRDLFWDTSLSRIHLGKHARYVIERVLEIGSLDAYNWLQLVYPSRKIMEVLLTSRGLSDKSQNYWRIWFGTCDA
jgi:hypothetical protein